jgi:hypothetical protein
VNIRKEERERERETGGTQSLDASTRTAAPQPHFKGTREREKKIEANIVRSSC